MKNLIKTGVLAAGLCASTFGWAGTAAGIDIINTAVATYDGGKVSASTTTKVQEVINVAIDANSPVVRVEAGDTAQILPFAVQNTGNGTETFKVTYVNSGDVTAENVKLYIDTNNDGVIDSGDTELTGDTITLDKDERISLLIQGDIPAAATENQTAEFSVTVSSTTEKDGVVAGTSAPGTILTGQGTGTSDAVVGGSASATVSAEFNVGATTAAVTITKTITQQIDPFGGATVIPGTKITYAITVVVDTTGGPVNNLVITDPLPSDLIYESGSLVVDGAGQTDADDAADNGNVTANVMTVDLGSVTSSKTYVINLTAQVK